MINNLTLRRPTDLNGVIELSLLVGDEVVVGLDLLPQRLLLNPELFPLDGLSLLTPQVFGLTDPTLQFGLETKVAAVDLDPLAAPSC